MSPRFGTRFIAMDTFEAMIENAIVPTPEAYDLDGETHMRSNGGQIETGALDRLRDWET